MAADFADWLAICETKARYCRRLDSKDWEGWADCFTPDLVLDVSAAGGTRIEGRDAAIRSVRNAIDEARTAHQVHNPEIAFDADGNAADVIWAMNDRVQLAPDRQGEHHGGHTGYGHYRERYLRCADGQWRIAALTLTYLHFDVHPR